MNAKHAGWTGGKETLAQWAAVLFGIVLGVALLKFVNPAIFEKMVEWPANGYEWVINPWPVGIGYWMLGGVALIGIPALRLKTTAPMWLIVLPLIWLAWQLIAATQTVDLELTRSTVKYFAACVACFYLGLFSVARLPTPTGFLVPICVSFALVLALGIQQHFGGLEASRQYFFTYVYPHSPSVPPDYLKKISSDRIFSTQFYPNALAGVVLLLLPATVALLWQGKRRFTAAARAFLCGSVGFMGLACLYWSGSKGGWLIMLLLGLVGLFRLPISARLKLTLVGAILVVGLTGFGLKYVGFFQHGATSVSARFDYWQAALRTAVARPVFGSGPGTFAISYKKIKRPESEMARLAHNDYLQQASDSGLAGFILYTGLIVGVLLFTKPAPAGAGDGRETLRFAIWLGLLGWSLQSLLEFGLYIPDLAWCGFGFMGWLLGVVKPIDKRFPNH